MDIFPGNKKAIGGMAAILVLITAVGIFVASRNNWKNPPNEGLAAYESREHGFSLAYPEKADLALEDVEPPQLVRIVMPEAYLDSAGKPANYTIEIVSGTVAEYRLYSKEITSGRRTFTLSLIGPKSQEVPQGVKNALQTVRDSFRSNP